MNLYNFIYSHFPYDHLFTYLLCVDTRITIFCGKVWPRGSPQKGLCRGEEGDEGRVASDRSRLVGGLKTVISPLENGALTTKNMRFHYALQVFTISSSFTMLMFYDTYS